MEYRHTPVMLQQCVDLLAMNSGETFCDCTLGGAGHSLSVAACISPSGLLIGIDQDPDALNAATTHIRQQFPKLAFKPLRGNFGNLDHLLVEAAVPGIDGILFDLGVSSYQLDDPQRGFSYAQDAPLDFRMDPGTQSQTAAEIINSFNEKDLTWIIRTYGEERWASRIAHLIAKDRERAPIASTSQLVEIIRKAIPAKAREQGGHPAKRTFQAFRIYINDELEMLRRGLDAAIRWLNPGGRIVVLSYHSLEDRIVKETFAKMAQGCICEPGTPICICGHEPVFSAFSRKPIVASQEEKAANTRSSSAKLRWGVKRSWPVPK